MWIATRSPVLPTASALLCFVFAVILARQWADRRRPHQLIWSIGMVWYGIASGADAVGQTWGWSESIYRTWYVAGAVMAAAWLGLGEVYLLRTTGYGEFAAAGVFLGSIPAVYRAGKLLQAGEEAGMESAMVLAFAGIGTSVLLGFVAWEWPERSGHAALIALVVGSTYAAGQVLGAPVTYSEMLDPLTGVPQGAGLPPDVRILTPMLNIGGALMLFFGAFHSGWSYWRDRRNAERAVSNLLIALGALTPSITGSLNRWGLTTSFYLGEFLGVLFIFAGFLASQEVITRHGRSLIASFVGVRHNGA
ncbi:MAG: hypothetical protein NTX54_06825 [Chloroflexi bacterium]|nr:hypothetical protein [Chloroflexota bacterium]